jgi:DNA-binding transcriptional MerR regulator
LYRIGELAKLAHVSKRTIDYYTQLELLTAQRTESNYRCYPEDTLHRLKLIEAYKKEKLSLEEIRERISWLDEKPVPAEEVTEKVQTISELLLDLEQRLLELKPMLRGMDEQQVQALVGQLAIRGGCVAQILAILIQDQPMV